MKKLYALILAVVMIISLFGCANGNDPVGTTDPSTETTLGDHEHDHGNETIGSTEGTENTEATEDTTAPTNAETIPDSPDDIGNGGVEDDPAKNMTEPTQPAPTEPAETKHEHNYTSKVTNPTCEGKGYTTYTCSCGDSYTGNETKATGHSYSSKTTNPTCDSDGYTKHTCSKCGKSYTDGKTPATGHSYKTETVAPTTEAEGYDIHTCSVCGKSYKDNYTDKLPVETEPACDHYYSYLYTAPTCTTDGYSTYTCRYCGDTYTEKAESALGHRMEADHVVEPTTESEGYTVYKCAWEWCDYTENRDYTDKLPATTEPAPTECNHEADPAIVAEAGSNYHDFWNSACECDKVWGYIADTRDGTIALIQAHLAESESDGKTHIVRGVAHRRQYDYPSFFYCIHCSEMCLYRDYYDYEYMETINIEWRPFG